MQLINFFSKIGMLTSFIFMSALAKPPCADLLADPETFVPLQYEEVPVEEIFSNLKLPCLPAHVTESFLFPPDPALNAPIGTGSQLDCVVEWLRQAKHAKGKLYYGEALEYYLRSLKVHGITNEMKGLVFYEKAQLLQQWAVETQNALATIKEMGISPVKNQAQEKARNMLRSALNDYEMALLNFNIADTHSFTSRRGITEAKILEKINFMKRALNRDHSS